jgi:DHA1 family tetracycline resistance protein-like MFS transporter
MEKIRARMQGKALPVVLFTIFLNVLGLGILIPVIPQLMANPASPDYLLPAGWDFKSGLILLGWLTAIFPLMQFVSTPILGQLSDRYGRKKILGFSLFGTAIGYVLFAIGILTKNIPLLFFARALDGITGGNISVAQAVVADVTPPKDRTKKFGLIGATFGLGFVLGPYLGAKLASPNTDFFGLLTTPGWFEPATPFWFAAILSLINATLIVVLLPETHPHINKKLKVKLSQALNNIIKAATYPGLRTVFPSVFLYYGGFTFFTTFFQVLLINKLHFSTTNVGDFFAYIGLWIAIGQIFITPQIAKRWKNYQVLRFSMFGTALAIFGLMLAGNTVHLLLIAPLFAILNGQFLANNTSLVSNSAGQEIQGEVLGINASVQALAQSVPAIISGYVASIGINTPIVVGSTVMIMAGVVFWILYKPPKNVLHQEFLPVTH